jgi:hypothetical protein
MSAPWSHAETRFKILFKLYQKHYGNEAGIPQNLDQLIQDEDLVVVEQNLLTGEIAYLLDRGFISGDKIIGRHLPITVMITSQGIDYVDRIIKKFVKKLYETSPIDYKQITGVTGYANQMRELPRIITNNVDALQNVIEKDQYQT